MCPPCSTGPTLLPSSSLTPPSLLFLINNFSSIKHYHFDSLWFDPQDFHLFFPLSRDLSWFHAFTQFWIILVLFRRQDHSNQNAKSLQNHLLQLFWPICKTEDIYDGKNRFTWICPRNLWTWHRKDVKKRVKNGGVNTYGQPDLKISVFYALPYQIWNESVTSARVLLLQCVCSQIFPDMLRLNIWRLVQEEFSVPAPNRYITR